MSNSDNKGAGKEARVLPRASKPALPGAPRPPRPPPPRPKSAALDSDEPVPVKSDVLLRGTPSGDESLLDADTHRLTPAGELAEESDVRPVPAVPADEAAQEEEAKEEEGEDVAVEDDPYIGTTIGDRYVVDAAIGEGGMGRVYLAHHKVIGKRVAIKILHAELARDKEAVGRFVREAKAASSVGNPHIVDISDFGETDDGSTYFVMEYLDGVSLADVMDEQGSLPCEMVCDIALQLCDGLAAAHRRDIVHRDLKPDNVRLVTQGKSKQFCKILDFGIAKVSTSTSSTKLTMAGAVFGTPHYMSPEQAAGAVIDRRTDIYSLGVMMYEMVSGKLPFNADNFMGILTQHMYKAPVPIRALVGAPECPPGLEALILKCLSKKPDARYQTMEALGEDIRKFRADGVPDAVQEMMARSGSFNVPADYFKGSPGYLRVSPQGPRSRLGPRIVAFVGVLVAVAVVLLVIMRGATTTAQQPEPRSQATTTPSAPSTPSANAHTVEVLVYATPVGAVAVVDGREVALPETFPIGEGEKKTLEIKAEGHESQTIELDGSNPKVSVELKRVASKPGVRYPPPKGRPKTPTKSGEVVNPWDH